MKEKHEKRPRTWDPQARQAGSWRAVAAGVACWVVAGSLFVLPLDAEEAPEAGNPFDAPILDVRPRVFIRADAFDGLTVEKLREAVRLPEIAQFRAKWRGKPLGRAIEWLLHRREEDLKAAAGSLDAMDAGGGTWSDRGQALVEIATLFDWLHADLDDGLRRRAIAKIEKAADAAVRHIEGGQAPFFYSRTPGALAGMAISGIALHGESEKAGKYLSLFRDWGVKDFFKSLQWVDGAATGATYTLFYTFVDLPWVCAAWWSATGRNPAEWIRRNQGGWLDGIVRFFFWYMRPGFAFTDINDQYRDIWGSHDQFCQGLDIASYVTGDGRGRAWSQRWLGKQGPALYHGEYAHNAIFRDPSLAPGPLTDLPLAELFGRESCGYGFFRSSWPADGEPDEATHVFFRCGDPVDVHGGVAAGEFQIFRHAPLAARSGSYSSYDSPPDQYHRNCISTNVVLFTDPADPKDRGDQNTRSGLKSDHRTWAEWLSIRERHGHDVARILDWRVGEGAGKGQDEGNGDGKGGVVARCRADLTRTNPTSKCKLWIRELVWLGGKHLVVLDVVETARPEIRRRWQLHSFTDPRVGERLITIVNEAPARKWDDESLKPRSQKGRLFCRLLLPRQYALALQAGGKAEGWDQAGRRREGVEPDPYHLEYGRKVIQIEPAEQGVRSVFLSVLTAVDAGQEMPPSAAYKVVGPGRIEVDVEGSRVIVEVPEGFEM